MKKWCANCKNNEPCVIIANDMSGNPTIAVCHRCGHRVT